MRDPHEDEAAERRQRHRQAIEEGRLAAPAVMGSFIDNLRDDLPDIERLLDQGRKMDALRVAARALGMDAQELAGILPSMTAEGLRGYCEGLLDGNADRAFIASPRYERSRREAHGRERITVGGEYLGRDGKPWRRALYGR